MSNYTRWYRVGNVKLVQGSRTIEGTDTYWLTAGINPGDLFTIDGAQFYEVDAITDNTHLTLKNTYAGVSTDDSAYSIIRNFTATMPAEIAARTAELLGDFRKYIDTDMRSIHGESAYEIALQNGYTGTEREWLESLKAAGELQTLTSNLESYQESTDGQLSDLAATLTTALANSGDLSSLETASRSNLVAAINELVNHQGSLSTLSTGVKSTLVAAINEVLANEGALSSLTTSAKSTLVAAINEVKASTTSNASNISILTTRTAHIAEANSTAYEAGFAHNLIYRGKCLGDKPTDEQLAAIAAGTFDDMYLGDYWNGVGESGWTGLCWMIVHFNYFADNWSGAGLTADTTNTASQINYAAGFRETTWAPHITVFQMKSATASEALNQKGGRLDRGYMSDYNNYFAYGSSNTFTSWRDGNGYERYAYERAAIPTFGSAHVVCMPAWHTVCTSTGIYTGYTGGERRWVAQPFWSHLTGEILPQSDEKFHRLAYVTNDNSGNARIDVNRRQFAAFRIRPFSMRGYGLGTRHAKFWLRDFLGPDSSGNPMCLLGDGDYVGQFRPRPISYSEADSTYHVYAMIA